MWTRHPWVKANYPDTLRMCSCHSLSLVEILLLFISCKDLKPWKHHSQQCYPLCQAWYHSCVLCRRCPSLTASIIPESGRSNSQWQNQELTIPVPSLASSYEWALVTKHPRTFSGPLDALSAVGRVCRRFRVPRTEADWRKGWQLQRLSTASQTAASYTPLSCLPAASVVPSKHPFTQTAYTLSLKGKPALTRWVDSVFRSFYHCWCCYFVYLFAFRFSFPSSASRVDKEVIIHRGI